MLSGSTANRQYRELPTPADCRSAHWALFAEDERRPVGERKGPRIAAVSTLAGYRSHAVDRNRPRPDGVLGGGQGGIVRIGGRPDGQEVAEGGLNLDRRFDMDDAIRVVGVDPVHARVGDPDIGGRHHEPAVHLDPEERMDVVGVVVATAIALDASYRLAEDRDRRRRGGRRER